MSDYRFKDLPCACDLTSSTLCEGCLEFLESESTLIPLYTLMIEREEC